MTVSTPGSAAFLLELGTEELPASVIEPASLALADRFKEMAAAEGLQSGFIKTFSTPRRLAILVLDLADRQLDRTEEISGPPVSIARDELGNPNHAALSFAKKSGISVADLTVRRGKRGDVFTAVLNTPGRRTSAVLMENLPGIVASIPFPKTMRWEASTFRFSRPIRWIVAMLGSEIIPFQVADVTAGSETWGHRSLAENPIRIINPESYEQRLLEARVVADSRSRLSLIECGLVGVTEQGPQVVADPELLATVNNLVEWPRVALGRFEEKYLELPREVLITVMRYHLKVFSLENASGQLVNSFAVVLGTEPRDIELTLKGFNRVLHARVEDARFFYSEDTRRRLEERVADLSGMLYLKGLGTVFDRLTRLRRSAAELADRVAPSSRHQAERAAHLCKVDLTTLMVNEFPELQGVMGHLYALRDGEEPAIAIAIKDHYRPRWAGDTLPSNDVGAIVAAVDKVDAIAGCFSLGMIPKGSHDPYALRRAAIGLVRILLERRYKIGLRALMDLAFTTLLQQNMKAPAPACEAAYKFVEGRMRVLFSERFPDDLVSSVIETGCDVPSDIEDRLVALQAARDEGWFDAVAVVFKRIQNISKKQSDATYSVEVLLEPAERELVKAFEESNGELESALAAGDYVRALLVLAKLKPYVDGFFDQVFVMVEDDQLRQSRLGLLKALAANFTRLADFTLIQAE